MKPGRYPRPATRRRAERLEARITRPQKALFIRAAELQGRSLTEFVIASAEDAARAAVRDQEALSLSDRDRQRFVAALLAPPSPTKALTQAARRYRDRTGR
jgi:uncharacterized protein (DUF1778 family)